MTDAGLNVTRWWRWFGPALRPVSWAYGRVALGRRRRLETRARTLPAPVISVGNITCGGTGKTPTVEMIARHLLELGHRPAFLSRGYGHVYSHARGDVEGNDEFHVLAANLPQVMHYQDKDRHRSGCRAIAAGADVLVLDDGFQHVRLGRDLDVVLLDATSPFGNGEVLPAGPLREPLEVLARADLFGLTRSDLVDRPVLSTLRAYLRRRWRHVPQVCLRARATGWTSLAGASTRLEALNADSVLAFCGIGNPLAFERQLRSLGVRPVDMLCFRDHHRYTGADIDRLDRRARRSRVDAVVTTQKDAVKIPLSETTSDWRFLRIEHEIACGEEEYWNALRRGLARGSSRRTAGASDRRAPADGLG